MVVKTVKENDNITTFYFSFSKKRKARISFYKNEDRIFFKNIKDNDEVSDNFECHFLRKQDYKKIFDFLTSHFKDKRIVFDLYCKEDCINIKNLVKYGFNQIGEKRYEFEKGRMAV